MKVEEIRFDQVENNYHLHVYRSSSEEILDEPKIYKVLKELGIEANLAITGWNEIHTVIMTSNQPSREAIDKLCRQITEIKIVFL